MNIQEKYIKRSLEIAKKGIGLTAPNPSVGAVIVYENKIIGEGYTSPFGGNHAEVNAIGQVADKTLLAKSTLYVTLEPCAHYGKTPPCANLIVKHKIPRVIIGCKDPNPKVAGKGIEILIKSGCEVTEGVLEKQCLQHHRRFITFQNKKRPYIILKWAECKNGFIAPSRRTKQAPFWISNKLSKQVVHKWRTEEQGILVGTRTAIDDNPELTARLFSGLNPHRIVIDNKNILNKNLKVFNQESLTLKLSCEGESKKTAFEIVQTLYANNISSVIIEGGAKTLQLFLDENLWDEARIFVGDLKIADGLKAPIIEKLKVRQNTYLNDQLNIYYND